MHELGTRWLVPLIAAAFPASLLVACAPAGTQIHHPMEVHFAAENGADGARDVPHWCRGGTCTVGPRVLVDERAVDRVMLQPGESRATLVLHLDSRGLARLKGALAGHAGTQRLSVVVDGKAVEAWTARKTLQASEVHVVGPQADMMRLYQRLTRPSTRGKKPPRRAPEAGAAEPNNSSPKARDSAL